MRQALGMGVRGGSQESVVMYPRPRPLSVKGLSFRPLPKVPECCLTYCRVCVLNREGAVEQ